MPRVTLRLNTIESPAWSTRRSPTLPYRRRPNWHWATSCATRARS
jgi:hypothetical protein